MVAKHKKLELVVFAAEGRVSGFVVLGLLRRHFCSSIEGLQEGRQAPNFLS
jgi:cell fate regulator YaaT (PSP1 superfamily)